MNFGIIFNILGWIISIEGAFMILPGLCGIIYGEDSWLYFIATAVVTLLLGIILIKRKPKSQQFFTKEGFAIVGLGWILMSAIGAIPLYLSRQIPFYIDALFEVVSGFTTTGASICPDVEALDHAVNLWRCFTHWIGGMGVLVFLLTILPMAGGNTMNLMKAESPGPSVGKLVPKIRDSAKILYFIYFGMTILQFILLVCAGMPVFDSICTSFGTAGTGGYGIKCSSIGGYSPTIQWIVTIFMILYGVNFNFYFFLLLGKNKKEAFKIEEVRWYIGIILVSIGIIVWNIHGMYSSLSHAVRDASFTVGSVITTTGFATADFGTWPVLSQTLLVIIMFCGACAGSTGGGIKVSRIMIILRAVKYEIDSFVHPRSVKVMRMDGKPVEKDTIRAAIMFMSVYVMVFTISIFVVAFDGFDLVTNFTSVTATFNNIGPGLSLVGPTGNYASFSILSKIVFIFDMLAGRLELFPILILCSPALWKKR